MNTPTHSPARLGWTGGLRAGYAFMLVSLALCVVQLYDCVTRGASPDPTLMGTAMCGLIMAGTAASVALGSMGRARAFAASALGVKLLTLAHAGWLSWRYRDALVELFSCQGPFGLQLFSWNGFVLSTTAIAVAYFGVYLARDARGL
jgi:hypothetical protein